MKKLLPLVGVACSLLLGNTTYAQSISVERNPADNTVKSIHFADNEEPQFENSQKLVNQYLELKEGYSWTIDQYIDITNEVSVRRFDLLYKGIEVEHGSASIIVKGDNISFIQANIFKDQGLSASPVISESDALIKALQHINATEYSWTTPDALVQLGQKELTQAPVGTLVWVQDFRPYDMERQLHLAYRFDIYATQPLSRDLVYVDANTGDILLKDPIIKHVSASAQSIYSGVVDFQVAQLSANMFEMYDSGRLVSTYDLTGSLSLSNAAILTSNNNSWQKSVAIDAHWGATQVYDYWKKEHNRNSYNGSGAELYSAVNYGNAYNNAFWNGYAMVYGNGTGMFNAGFDPLVALDVCAHEVGHGICQFTSGLVYNRESGAMNEGFSDIWGAVIENYATPDKQMWNIGEELKSGALRSMSRPELFNDPDTYEGQNWVTVVGCTPNSGNDNCGVHTNSGVLNHWFYLLVEGRKGINDKGNNFEVAGIGLKKAAKIAYATEVTLHSTATYADCRNASISVATTMYGSCSREVEAVTRAWYAVNVGNAFAPCAPQIGFTIADTSILTDIGPSIKVCPAVKQLKIPLRVTGGTPTGGNAVLTFTGAGTAKNGADYTIPSNTITFNSGSTASQDITVNIYDNGDTTREKILKLYFTIAQNGSNALTSYTYDTCTIKLIDIKTAPATDTHVSRVVNRADISTKAITPFFGRNSRGRMQFVITAKELEIAGIEPNVPIDTLGFYVTQKNSTQAFSAFTLKIDGTTFSQLNLSFATVNTQYYSGNYTTTKGWNMIPLSTPLIWDGMSNLAIETCFGNTSVNNENDYIAACGTNDIVSRVVYSNTGSACNMNFTSGFKGISKPVISLVQRVSIRSIETDTAESREWQLNALEDVFFYNYDNDKLIANVNNVSTDFGCSKAVVIAKGNGLTSMTQPFATANKTVKEFQLAVSQNGHNAKYDMTVYFDTAELSGTTITTPYIIATNVTVDSLMDTTNSVAVIATRVNGSNSIGYKATFNKVYQRYYVVDQAITIPVPETESVSSLNTAGFISVDNNPFRDKIFISYNVKKATWAKVLLYDITGRLVYDTREQLQSGKGRFSINVSGNALVSGTYVLQVITDTELMIQQVAKH